jgi:hypothetical protein
MSTTKYQQYLKSEHWRILRGAKLQVCPTCEVCGSKEEIEVHHKIYRDSWFDSRLQDLKTVCHYHHICEHVPGLKEGEKNRVVAEKQDAIFRDGKSKTPRHGISMEKRNALRAKKGRGPIFERST